MPPSKGPAERGYMLQAQEQGTGTTLRRCRDSQGMPSPSLWDGEEGDWGELRWAWGCGQHSLAPLVLGGPPEEARHPLSAGKETAPVGLWMLQCAQRRDLPVVAGESPSAKPPAARAARMAPAARRDVRPGSHIPAATAGPCLGVSWREPPSATRERKALESN